MIIVPKDAKCDFCTRIFCCSKCRRKHEENSHADELKERKQVERIKSLCYLCNGEKLPLELDLQSELMQHIVDCHLPLKCGKCSTTFETEEGLKNAGKCCESKMTPTSTSAEMMDKGIIGSMLKPDSTLDDPTTFEKPLTPMSKINQRWRRKSKEFSKPDGSLSAPTDEKQRPTGTIKRPTSTPLLENLLTTQTFAESLTYNASSIQISSISCISSSSESDGYSPVIVTPKQTIPETSPKRIPRPPTQSRSRPKMPVQATPLRQVMSKSIQRAIQQHGHYWQSPTVLQQRKMSFNATNSSSESTINLMQFSNDTQSPLDLRLSPAVRRASHDVENAGVAWEPQQVAEIRHHMNHIEFEQIEVIIRRGEIKSDSTAVTTYKTCLGEAGRTGSLPDIQITPKFAGNNFLKKTISFETPQVIDQTPSFLMPNMMNGDDGDEDEDDVFYTPNASPAKRRTFAPIDNDENKSEEKKPGRNLWNIVSSVMRIASRGSEESDGSGGSDKAWKFNFKKPSFVQKAAEYFSKRQKESLKRRRTSSSSSRAGSQSSPLTKRPKIQARRPIGRMRNVS